MPGVFDMTFPPIPSWDGLHPLIVHFPVALLLSAPLFVVLGALFPKTRGLSLAALLLMLMGTVGAFLAVETGKAAGELAVRTAQVSQTLEGHEELAETTRDVFAGLTVLFALLLIVPKFLRKQPTRRVSLALTLVFLAAYSVGGLYLVNTAHQGGRLVHELGVQALIG
jgi:uncharacterized membrane protein